jgi:hypothetical protein
MTARLDHASMTNSQPVRITLEEILQQPKLWPTTLERIAKLQDSSIFGERQTVICGAGTSA